MKKLHQRILISWLRFSRKHRRSNKLPIALFILLFLDGFIMLVPSLLCLMISVTLSPFRWPIFAVIYIIASTLNNVMMYVLGRLLSASLILELIQFLHMEMLWEKAQEALHAYGPFATFIGSLVGLPTQMMAALIGIADKHQFISDGTVSTTGLKALAFVFLGQTLKAFVVSGFIRFGWLKVERRLEKELV